MPTPPPMNHFLALFIEFAVYIFAFFLIRGAKAEGPRWLSTLIWGIVFGIVTEWLIIHSDHSAPDCVFYIYNDGFMVNLGTYPKSLPLWVGVGWGCILYGATWTAQRLEAPPLLRSMAAGLLAVNIDLSLDPLANLVHFWDWQNVKPDSFHYYGVPFDNYLGWFTIVAAYSCLVPLFFRLYDKVVGRQGKVRKEDRYQPSRGGELIVPPLAAGVATGLLVLVRGSASSIYRGIDASTIFLVVLAAATVVLAFAAFKARRDHDPNWPVLAIPIFFHVFAVIGLHLGKWSNQPALATLLVAIPSHLLFGLFGFAWPSLEKLFPGPARRPVRERGAEPPASRPPPRPSKHPAEVGT